VVPKAKIGLYTKYPRMRSDQKTYFLKNGNKDKIQQNFDFLPNQWTVVVLRAKIGFQL